MLSSSRIKVCSDSTDLLTLADEVTHSAETSEPIYPKTVSRQRIQESLLLAGTDLLRRS